jgi:hypothetical protein
MSLPSFFFPFSVWTLADRCELSAHSSACRGRKVDCFGCSESQTNRIPREAHCVCKPCLYCTAIVIGLTLLRGLTRRFNIINPRRFRSPLPSFDIHYSRPTQKRYRSATVVIPVHGIHKYSYRITLYV